MATSFALAQDSKHDPEVRTARDTDEQQFLFDSDLAMSNMNRSMLMTPTGDIDRDFVNVMVPHHQGAIDMARAEIRYGHNDELRQLAQRIVGQQEREISVLQHALSTIARAMPSGSGHAAQHTTN
ncbi:DUF305 domain-containing protein [Bradyrhizobium sp. CB1650]|uniref:DUF305 domain-containing protein n=1 Tax=Bradyrhizobium sp. CB1650 TaxID=3039153 RepID=UPI00243508B8|nr:DUF305 domain-containing protein [Bradyrhizobium sp. CB1650]WGD50225.1 DUF305 domain-containing protein [Bradyrhizobium sp. CB1650]